MDKGVRLIKSGTDFRDLTEAWLELERQVEGSVRRMTVKTLRGRDCLSWFEGYPLAR